MIVNTTRFGEINVSDDAIVNFPEGIIGFETVRRFFLYEQENSGMFRWLQAVDVPELAFVLIRPEEFYCDYALDITRADADILELEEPVEVEIWAIVVIPGDPARMTANLQGPVVINTKNMIGRQVVSTNPRHRLRHYILDEMKKLAEKTAKDQKPDNEPDSSETTS